MKSSVSDSRLPRTMHFLESWLESFNSPTSLGLYLCIKHGDFRSLVSHSIDPLKYESVSDFLGAYVPCESVSKLTGIPGYSDDERSSKAIETYLAVEDELRRNRHALQGFMSGTNWSPAFDSFSRAKGKVHDILGACDVDAIAMHARLGPGSSSSVRGRGVSAAHKLTCHSTECTQQCLPWVTLYAETGFLSNFDIDVTVKQFTEIVTVPKNSKTDRVIGIEPDWNIFFQLGVGQVIRSRLRRVGVDLNHGADRHARLARQASVDGRLCTIDLSSASDRISRELVRELLPPRWFAVLDSLRTPTVKVGEFPFPIEKFSSMGNGYTFELQSLIFYALAVSTARVHGCSACDISVFGDDIIVPSVLYAPLVDVFAHLGFKVNEKKSFATGYFRESCGHHFFKGSAVKPPYFRSVISNEIETYKAHNKVVRYCYRHFGVHPSHTHARGPVSILRSWYPRGYYLPDDAGDGGFVECFDRLRSNFRFRRVGPWSELYRVQSLVLCRGKRDNITCERAILPVLYHLHRRDLTPIFQLDLPMDTPDEGVFGDLRSNPVYRRGSQAIKLWKDPGI